MAEVGSSLSLLIHGYANILRVGRDAQDFIKDDLPANANPINKWGQEVLRRSCRRFARANVPGIGVVNSPIWGSVCDPYLNSINEGPTSGGNYGPPFTGGQCSVKYSVTATGTYTQSNQCTNPSSPSQTLNWSFSRDCTNPFGIYGPIGSPYLEPIGSTGLSRILLPSRDSNGNPTTTALQSNHCGLKGGWSLTSLIVTRCDGQPDNCGNLPSTYTPPSYPPNLPTLPTPTNPAPGLGNGWDVTVNPDGTFNICIGSECTPNINPDGSGPNTGEDPGEPEGPPQENDPNDPNDNRIAGCVGEGNILTGIKVTFTQVPTNVSGPLDYYRNVAIIGFGPDSQKIDLVADGKLMIDGQFVIPDSDFCRCYRLDITPGWGLSVQAYSRPEKTE